MGELLSGELFVARGWGAASLGGGAEFFGTAFGTRAIGGPDTAVADWRKA
jgi:hypothetical protein